MVSPNFFLKLNISFNIIIGLIIIINNYIKNNFDLFTNLIGLFFIYISINNIIILKQKSSPQLKKEILKTNTFIYIVLLIFVLYNLKKLTNLNNNDLMVLFLLFFIQLINYIGYKITKVN